MKHVIPNVVRVDIGCGILKHALSHTRKLIITLSIRILYGNWNSNYANEQSKHLKKQYPNKSKQIDELINTTQSHAKNIIKRDNMNSDNPRNTRN